jgi:hypothetical protein
MCRGLTVSPASQDHVQGLTFFEAWGRFGGVQIVDLPYILTLQLKRFDFDPLAMRRVKISDRVSFPEQLNAEPYLAEVPQFQRRVSLGLQRSSRSTRLPLPLLLLRYHLLFFFFF